MLRPDLFCFIHIKSVFFQKIFNFFLSGHRLSLQIYTSVKAKQGNLATKLVCGNIQTLAGFETFHSLVLRSH